MDFESIINTIQPFVIMFAALLGAFLTALWVSAVIWTFRDIRARSRDVFAQILATLLVLLFFPLFPLPGLLLYFILRPRETLSEVYERSLEEEVLLQGIEERLACPGCNRRIEESFMICPTCHTRLKKACPACGRLLHLRWNICPYCGATQTTAKAAPTVSPPPVVMPVEPPTEVTVLRDAMRSSLPEPMEDARGEPTPSQETRTQPMAYSDYEPEAPPPPEPEPPPPSEPEPESEPPLREMEEQDESETGSRAETLPFDFD